MQAPPGAYPPPSGYYPPQQPPPTGPRYDVPYQHSLFGAWCGDCSTCWCAFLSPCTVYGRNHARLGLGSESDGCKDYCFAVCFDTEGRVGLHFREKMHEYFGLEHDACGDCLAHACFPCCALTQDKLELDYQLEKRQAAYTQPPHYQQMK